MGVVAINYAKVSALSVDAMLAQRRHQIRARLDSQITSSIQVYCPDSDSYQKFVSSGYSPNVKFSSHRTAPIDVTEQHLMKQLRTNTSEEIKLMVKLTGSNSDYHRLEQALRRINRRKGCNLQLEHELATPLMVRTDAEIAEAEKSIAELESLMETGGNNILKASA